MRRRQGFIQQGIIEQVHTSANIPVSGVHLGSLGGLVIEASVVYRLARNEVYANALHLLSLPVLSISFTMLCIVGDGLVENVLKALNDE